MIESPNDRFGLIASGKAYNDTRQALLELGLDDDTCRQLGVRLHKVGVVWPLEAQLTREFATGLQEILVVEEKRQVIEYQIKEELYNWRADVRPNVLGKFNDMGGDHSGGEWSMPNPTANTLLRANADLSPALIAAAIAQRLKKMGVSSDIAARMDARLAVMQAKETSMQVMEVQADRQPWFCSGCPHNTSTKVPEGSRAMAGIGCHFMSIWMDRATVGFTQMGGEGVPWVGQQPFSTDQHMFANIGDGTYFHSGILAIRQSIAAGVRVSGPDLASISRSAERIAQVLSQVPGTRSAFAERAADARQIDVVPDRELLARHAVTMEDAQALLASAIGGEAIGRAVEGRERYPIALRTPQAWRDSPEAIAALPVVTPSGAQLPLGALATVRLSEGPPMIRSEDAQLATYVFVDLDEADLGRYIARAEQALQKDARLAEGVSWRWAGSYEHLQRAGERLRLAVPLTLLIVFGLLYAAFRRVAEASLVMLTLPFALVGGLWLLWALGYAFSVAVAVGFIALAGVAAEFGVVMLIYLDAAVTRARAAGHLSTVDELDAALREGALRRVRPKLMTVVTIVVGLLPIAFASGAGAATMQRIAAPMIGGMLSAPLLSLVVIPAVYKLWLRRRLPKANGAVP